VGQKECHQELNRKCFTGSGKKILSGTACLIVDYSVEIPGKVGLPVERLFGGHADDEIRIMRAILFNFSDLTF